MTKIPKYMRPDMSALRRLVMVTCLVFIGFLVFSITAFTSLRYVGKDLHNLVEHNLVPAIDSARTALDIGRSMAEVNYILSVCSDTDFSDEIPSHHILDSFTTLASDTRDLALRDSLIQFTKDFNSTLADCQSVKQMKKEINSTGLQLADTIKSLDESVANLIIAGKINGTDTSVLERLPLSITHYTLLQLSIESLFPRLGVVFFEKELNKKDHPIFTSLDEFAMASRILSGYDKEVSDYGVRIAYLLQYLNDLTENFHRVAGNFFSDKQELKTSKESLLTYMKEAENILQVSSRQRADSLKKNFNWMPLAGFLLVSLPLIIMIFSALLARSAFKSLKKTGESEAKYRTLTENLPQQIFVKDKDSVFISCNENFARFIGSSTPEIIGKRDNDFFPDDIASQYQAEDIRVMSSGQVEMIEQPYTQSAQEMIIQIVKTPLRDSNGEVAGVLGIFWDITERRQAEEKLNFMSQISRQITSSVITTNLNFEINWTNPAFEKLYGYTHDEVIGRSPEFLNAEKTAEEIQKDIYQTVYSGKVWSDEILNKRKDGSFFPCEMEISSLVDERGEVIGYSSQQKDITDRKEMALALQNSKNELENKVQERTNELKKMHEQLLHSGKLAAIGGLSASIAHEFNNPLQGVMTVIKGVKRRASLDEEDVKLVDMAVKECNRMRDLIKSLQDFNRPSSGRVAPMNIHGTIDSLLMLSKKDNQSKGITVKTNYAEDMPQIKAVADQIKQVVLNLLNNASYACERGGTITIITNNIISEDNVVIKIQDTGKGINPEHLDKIFDPFFTTKPAIKGTGLGLSVSYGIVKKHGGRIEVESELDTGTTFTITLPIAGVNNAK